MTLIEQVIRSDIREIAAYAVAESDGFLKLNAMENPYPLPVSLQNALAQRLSQVALNRYPVPSFVKLKKALAKQMGIPAGYNVLLGNGSDELIFMIATACAKKDKPAVMLSPVPGFVMYSVSAQFAGMDFIGVPLKEDFSLDVDAMLEAIAKHKPSVVFLAQPHNPTGNLFNKDDVIRIIQAMKNIGIVVSDEAYHPFAQTSFMDELPHYDNLVVMRTVSKLGLAGIRLGYMSASSELLNELDKVRLPYNINVLTEATALFALENLSIFDEQAAIIREQRDVLSQQLSQLPGFTVYPSRANFLLVRVNDANAFFEKLYQQKVLIKNLHGSHPLLTNCLRITVSSPEENALFMKRLKACL